ncbi:MAG: xanthine dehydrogenase family protein molybdopterin-binding subunit [Armatimonadetes bacterium]|nr:xanthine dehydrogenase family protein molybdopterin-binding subunit [Armatimonadota bacterium]
MARKVRQTIVENGFEREVEIEVPDGPVVSWGDPKKLRILGHRNPRVDGLAKITGQAKYTSDINLPGMLYGRIYRSPYASAIINSPEDVDLSGAEKIPGVVALNLIAGRTVIRCVGHEIAAVAAPTPELAEDAVRAIRVRFQTQPFVVNDEKARQPGAPQVRPDIAGNVAAGGSGGHGDVDAAFQAAKATSEGTYRAQTRVHSCLETHGHVCKWDGGRLTVWASTQMVHGTADAFADLAGGRKNVRVICEYMGGGFGSKFGPGVEGAACARLARKANRPVKLMLPRYDEQVMHFRGPGLTSHIRLAGDETGRITGAIVRNSSSGGISIHGTPMERGYYIIEPASLRVTTEAVLTHTSGTSALRAPGHPQASWVWECAMDDLAAALNIDPLQFRLRNHQHPVRTAEWSRGAELIGWSRRNPVPGEGGSREGESGVPKAFGIGMASATWTGGGGAGTRVQVKIDRDGSVIASVGSQCLGTGTRNFVAGIVAEELGLELKDVEARIGDSSYPPAGASGGSNTAASVAPSVKMAALDARDKMAVAVARYFNLKSEEAPAALVFVPGKIQLVADPQRSLSWKQACQMLPAAGLDAQGTWNADLCQGGVAGCCFAEVEVDTETGRVRPVKIVSIQDCGFVLNLMQAESQIYGGVVQGIAHALLEERVVCEQTGRLLNPNLEDYKLTLALEVPEVIVEIFENPTGKVSGIGEPPVIPVAAAIGNAVFNAIGARIYEAPITPDRVLAALARKRGAAA